MNQSELSLNRQGKVGEGYIYLISLVAAVGGFLFGYDLSVISGALFFIEKYFQLDAATKGFAVSSAILGSIGGPLFGMWLSDAVGRRKTLAIAALCFMVSAIGTALPHSIGSFIFWRVIGGIGVGLAAMTSPIYITEIAPPELRGRLVTINQLAIVVGGNIAVIVSYALSFGGHWRWMFASELVPVTLLMIGLYFVPRSPRWLAANGKTNEALKVLVRINGRKQAEEELKDIQMELEEELGTFRELIAPRLRRALVIGIVIMLYSQINGVNMMFLYGPTILAEAGIGDPSQSIFFTIFLNAFVLMCTITAFWIVKHYGRREILITGVIGMVLGHLAMAITFISHATPFLNLAAMFIAGGSFTLSLAPLSWVIVSEIFPNKVRGKALAIVVCILWISSFLCAQVFPMLTAAVEAVFGNPGGAYLFFAAICTSCVLFIWRVVPETKDLRLEEINRFWKDRLEEKCLGSERPPSYESEI